MSRYDQQRPRRVGSSARTYSTHATNEIPENCGFYVSSDGDYTLHARVPAPGQETTTAVTLTLKEGSFCPIDVRLFTSGDDITVVFYSPYDV